MNKIALIVDDSPLDRMLISETLSENGFSISAMFDDGCKAVGYFEQLLSLNEDERPSLLFLDLKLPGMNGHEVLERKKMTPGLEWLRVIMVTNSDSPEDREKAIRMGADFFTKPLAINDYRHGILEILENS